MKSKTLITALVAVSTPIALIAGYAAADCGLPPTDPPPPPNDFISCQSDNGYFGFASINDGSELFLNLLFGNGAPVFASSLGYDSDGDHIPGCTNTRDQPGAVTADCSESIFFLDLVVIDG
jgi:hypothetical protein